MTTPAVTDVTVTDEVRTCEDVVRDAILRLLAHFPKLTKTMISSHVKPYDAYYHLRWRDVFDRLVSDGTIIESTMHIDGRDVRVYELNPR